MKTEKQQTVVEWLHSELIRIKNLKRDDMDEVIARTFKQAKKMEKEQMCKFAYKCHNHYKVYGDFKIDQYYNETFKSE